METLTIFTPTYNRAHTLPRTYESLKGQKNKNFIWLIIDDGSTDETKSLVQSWISTEQDFRIEYKYKKNGGMHTAHNLAYEVINTELNMCIDSDDMLSEDAVESIITHWELNKKEEYAGIIGLDVDINGEVIGKQFPNTLYETTLGGYYSNGGSGDKKLVYRTELTRRYPPYPVFEGEKYVALAYKYRLIDQDYKLTVLNKPLCIVEYQRDGSTMNMYKQYVNNPKGFAFWRIFLMQHSTSKRRVVIDCIHYISSSLISKDKHFIMKSPQKTLTIVLTPIGALFTLYVKYKAGLYDQ